jgi:hypothetical protein
MRKSYSVRLHLSQSEGDEIKRIAATEERSQAETLSRLIRDGLRFRHGEVSSVGRIVSILRGETDAAAQ